MVAACVGLALLVGPKLFPAAAAAQAMPRRLTVAAASDLQAVMPGIVEQFEKTAAAAVAVSFGASGTFFAQIRNGAPFDVFLSADSDYPKQLASAGLGDPATLYTYATGHIVLWTRRDSGVDLATGLAGLTNGRVRHIAVANPKLAPYGRAAVAALQRAGVYAAVEPKLVFGENISQTAQLAESGNADVGIVSLSLALGNALKRVGRYVEVPSALYPPIEQAAIVVRASPNAAVGRAFVEHLRVPSTKAHLSRFGLTPPSAR